MYRVLIDQKKFITAGGTVIKSNEYQTFNHKGHMLPKIGGVVEDRLQEVLGYTYSDESHESKKERGVIAPYDWTNPFVKIDKKTIEKYEIKKEVVKESVAI